MKNMNSIHVHDTQCILCFKCYLTFTHERHLTTIVCSKCLSESINDSYTDHNDQNTNHDDSNNESSQS